MLVSKLFHKIAPAYLAVLLSYCVVFTLEIKRSPFAAFHVLLGDLRGKNFKRA